MSIGSANIYDVDITSGTIAGMDFTTGGITAGDWNFSSNGLSHNGKAMEKKTYDSVRYMSLWTKKIPVSVSGSCSIEIDGATYYGSCSASGNTTEDVGYRIGYVKMIYNGYGEEGQESAVVFTPA